MNRITCTTSQKEIVDKIHEKNKPGVRSKGYSRELGFPSSAKKSDRLGARERAIERRQVCVLYRAPPML